MAYGAQTFSNQFRLMKQTNNHSRIEQFFGHAICDVRCPVGTSVRSRRTKLMKNQVADSKGKKVKTMKYEKPEVGAVANAHESIQGGKSIGSPVDGQRSPNVYLTTP